MYSISKFSLVIIIIMVRGGVKELRGRKTLLVYVGDISLYSKKEIKELVFKERYCIKFMNSVCIS